MADRYVDDTYVEAVLGATYIAACVAESGRNLDVLIEAATSLVQSAMRNSGLATPASAGGTGIEEVVKLAVVGQLVEIVATAPVSAVPLPESWAESPLKMALAQILEGAIQTVADPSAVSAVGGFAINSSSAPRKTTRTDMDMW